MILSCMHCHTFFTIHQKKCGIENDCYFPFVRIFPLAESVALQECVVVMTESWQPIPTTSRRYGVDAWLVEFASEISDEAWEIAEAIRRELLRLPPPALKEFTFSYTRVLLEFETGRCPASAPSFKKSSQATAKRETKIIDVCYDGEDLERVARHCRMSKAEVIRCHSEALYRVHFLGFAPGFPYLSGLPSCLHTPRLDTPRVRIPAGAVGIGGAQTGIYPLPTAGGWNLIGRVREALFNPLTSAETCTMLQPGDLIQFRSLASFE
jgi:inhibitor of KinA